MLRSYGNRFWQESLLDSFPGMLYMIDVGNPIGFSWLNWDLLSFIDYDYDYYGYGDYRGGYSDPYYDDFYRYEDYYYEYQPVPTQARGRGRQTAPVWDYTIKFLQINIIHTLFSFVFNLMR